MIAGDDLPGQVRLLCNEPDSSRSTVKQSLPTMAV